MASSLHEYEVGVIPDDVGSGFTRYPVEVRLRVESRVPGRFVYLPIMAMVIANAGVVCKVSTRWPGALSGRGTGRRTPQDHQADEEEGDRN